MQVLEQALLGSHLTNVALFPVQQTVQGCQWASQTFAEQKQSLFQS
jgi:hypothetical protein